MSQEKVDRYKQEKVNRKQIMRKQKLMNNMRKGVLVVVALALIGWLGKYLYLVDGEMDWFRLMLVYGVPVGIPYMFFIIPARWDLSGTIGMVALCAIIGAVFGFIIAIGIAIRAVWYVIAFPISCLLRKEKNRI